MPLEPKLRLKARRGETPLILLTNDDGVRAKGVCVLAERFGDLGRVIVVAPEREMSASSHAITLDRPLRINKHSENFYSVDGTPTDCINLGVNEILKEKPDVVVSGINCGPNLGDDIHYSGTVSAAIEGAIFGIPSVAISIAGTDGLDFRPAAEFAHRVVEKILKEGLPTGIVLNVNIPSRNNIDLDNYVFTIQGRRNYSDIIVEKVDPRGVKYYWICGTEDGFDTIPESDCVAIHEGRISITPIKANMTDYEVLQEIRKWRI